MTRAAVAPTARGCTLPGINGGHAIGLNGKDDDLIIAHSHGVELGWVGDVDAVNAALLRLLEAHGVIPVVAPIATGRDGATYNVNADHVAGAVAAALGAAVLLQLTDVPGVLDHDGHHIPLMSRRGVERLIREGVIDGGMVPKVGAALNALRGGAARMRIVDGRQPQAVTLGLLGNDAPGTEIVL
jgi:acetylglutamate kinase